MNITIAQLIECGLDNTQAQHLLNQIIQSAILNQPAEEAWFKLSQTILTSDYPFSVHLFLFNLLFPTWQQTPERAPQWHPNKHLIANANITKWMKELALETVHDFHQWTITHWQLFWRKVIQELDIIFDKAPEIICDLTDGLERPHWFPEATLNICDSCFTAPTDKIALIHYQEKTMTEWSYGQLQQLTNQVANSLVKNHFSAGDAIAIAMPMTPYAIAIYLGIIKMGGIVVGIADSFSSIEMATRLRIAKVKGIFTQDMMQWGGKKLTLYTKVKEAIIESQQQILAIVLSLEKTLALPLTKKDLAWVNFLEENTTFNSIPCEPMSPCNILFSSGTTGDPKAIVWNHTTPIKAASDAYFHQNILTQDVLAWPTNLGWMMGPWLIFAALINKASIALYTEAPKDRAFGEFIEKTKVTMLGIVPTLVHVWRQTACMEGLNFSRIKVFSSTGECSNPEDMLYLSYLAGYKPIIEYCGGTEIGGAYLSSTVVEKNYPSLFSTPTMGLNFIILNEQGESAKMGEVAIIPPSLGLSTVLLNANHYQIYYENMPTIQPNQILRRHGDQIKQLPNHYYCVLGRVDDTMNLGGIKISAVEIERVLSTQDDINEVAAIAVTPENKGPSQLIIYVVTKKSLDKMTIKNSLQKKINAELNPLFKIHDIVFIAELPKTASNKIMRRLLRDQYQQTVTH